MALEKINKNSNENFTGFFQGLQERSQEMMRKAKIAVEKVLLDKHTDQQSREKEQYILPSYNSPLTSIKDNFVSMQLLKKNMNQTKQTILPLHYILSENENFSITTKPDMEYSITKSQNSFDGNDESQQYDYSHPRYNITIKRDNKMIREYKQAKIDIKQNQENDGVTLSISKNTADSEQNFIIHPSHPFETSYITKIQQTT